MRLFFGLGLSGRDAMAIAQWRTSMLPPLAKPVPVANLHLTLAFLGEVNPTRRAVLEDEVDALRAPGLAPL